jgi:hypothetical protein
MRAPTRQTLRTRNGVRSVIIERRAIPTKGSFSWRHGNDLASCAREANGRAFSARPENGAERGGEPMLEPVQSAPRFPLAADVARVLACGPVRFPDVWWR